MSRRNIRAVAARRSRAALVVALVGILGLSCCYGVYTVGAGYTVGAEYPGYYDSTLGVQMSLASDVPQSIQSYPSYYYQGSYAYLVDGRWYYP